jgi:adenylylsulfate kinase
MNSYINAQLSLVNMEERQALNGHKSFVLWLTGLSGSGKTTLAKAIEKRLFDNHVHAYVLDGDKLRLGLNKDLGFSQQDRQENIRRVGELAKLLVEAGIVAITSTISPYREDRNAVREKFADRTFIEVYLTCPLEVCESRDPKGLYRRARSKEIPDFTGIDSPYEEPIAPELLVPTDQMTLDEAVDFIFDYLNERALL